MKNKKWLLLILFLLVCVSLIYTFVKKGNKEDKINTNVNVTVDLDNTYSYDEDYSEEQETVTYAPPSEPIGFLSKNDLLESETVTTSEVNTEQVISEDVTETKDINFDTILDESNFVNNFINLLDSNLQDYELNNLPVTENIYNLNNGIILDDAYNNGFIVLRVGFNEEENTFMCLIRTVNQRTYFKGTLVDGKIDTITSIVLK